MSEDSGPIPFQEINLDDLSVEQAVADLMAHAAHLPASDLFFASGTSEVAISVRHLGICKPLIDVTREEGRRFINHVKASAGMDVAQKMRPQDGRWVCRSENGEKIDLRINTIPTLHGEDMAIRLLDSNLELLDLGNLGFHRKNLENLVGLLSRPSGLILVTGPAGAGKTTTLYACLQHLNDGKHKINTIEDPIEFELEGIRQSQVHPKIKLDFPEMLASILRQSPDVIMIGEIRDPVTAETAARAANSGHLVFATLHAPVAAGAIENMLAMEVIPHFLATSLIGVVSQRLVRRLCDQCKVAYDLSGAPETFADVKKLLGPDEGEKIYSAPGCEHCHQAGYTGRTGVSEVLRVTKEIRQAIYERQRTQEIRQIAMREGMLDLRCSALLKVAQGVTSTEEVVRMIPTEHLLPDD